MACRLGFFSCGDVPFRVVLRVFVFSQDLALPTPTLFLMRSWLQLQGERYRPLFVELLPVLAACYLATACCALCTLPLPFPGLHAWTHAKLERHTVARCRVGIVDLNRPAVHQEQGLGEAPQHLAIEMAPRRAATRVIDYHPSQWPVAVMILVDGEVFCSLR